MNHNEVPLFYNLINYGIQTGILEVFPFDVTGICQLFKNCYLMNSSAGSFALWLYQGQEAGLAYQHQLLTICRQHKAAGFLFPIELSNGCTYSKLNEKSWFYVTEWLNLEKVSYRNPEHVKSMVDLIVIFRQCLTELGLTFCHPDRKNGRNLVLKTAEAIDQLHVFALLAKRRIKPTCFDQLFLQAYPTLLTEAEVGHQLFKESSYTRLNLNLTTQNININDFSRGNLRIGPDKAVYCLGLKNYCWDIPVIDLAELLVKTGRSNRWKMDWFIKIIGYYQQFFALSNDEMNIIKAYLRFPWNMYRLTSRYYFNKVEWPLSKFIEKLERAIKDETVRKDFANQLNS